MEETKKMNFFGRIKNAIFKLENYGVFLGERFSIAFKYFLLLILLITIIITTSETYIVSKMIDKGYLYVKNQLPDFSYENGQVVFNEKIEAYDEEYKFSLFINTDEDITEDIINEYVTKIYDGDYGVILLNSKLIYIAASNISEYSYSEIESYLNIEPNDKQELIEEYNLIGKGSIISIFFFTSFIGIYLSNVIILFSDVLVLAIFGYISARICRIKIKIAPTISIAIYSLTLSILLSTIYSVVLLFTGFVINYFNIMYLLVAYVYVIAAILMIKADLIKHNYELSKIIEVQEEVRRELEERKKEEERQEEENSREKRKKEKKEREKQEDIEPEINAEPDGSEI